MSLAGLAKILTSLHGLFDGVEQIRSARAKLINDYRLGDVVSAPAASRTVGIRKLLTENQTGMSAKTAQVRTIDERLEHIIDLVRKGKRNPRVRLLAAKILNRKCNGQWCIKEKDYPNEIKAIFNAVRSQVRYMMDARGVDQFQSPARTWGTFHGGDCDDFTSLLCALLESAGYHCKLRVVSVKPAPKGDWSHILALVGLPPRAPTRWVPLDASVNQPPGWYPTSRISGFKDYDIPV